MTRSLWPERFGLKEEPDTHPREVRSALRHLLHQVETVESQVHAPVPPDECLKSHAVHHTARAAALIRGRGTPRIGKRHLWLLVGSPAAERSVGTEFGSARHHTQSPVECEDFAFNLGFVTTHRSRRFASVIDTYLKERNEVAPRSDANAKARSRERLLFGTHGCADTRNGNYRLIRRKSERPTAGHPEINRAVFGVALREDRRRKQKEGTEENRTFEHDLLCGKDAVSRKRFETPQCAPVTPPQGARFIRMVGGRSSW